MQAAEAEEEEEGEEGGEHGGGEELERPARRLQGVDGGDDSGEADIRGGGFGEAAPLLPGAQRGGVSRRNP